MTNRIALWIVALIALATVLNFALGWGLHIFLGRKLLDLTDWMAFWR